MAAAVNPESQIDDGAPRRAEPLPEPILVVGPRPPIAASKPCHNTSVNRPDRHDDHEGEAERLRGQFPQGARAGGVTPATQRDLDRDPGENEVHDAVADQTDADQNLVAPAVLHLGCAHPSSDRVEPGSSTGSAAPESQRNPNQGRKNCTSGPMVTAYSTVPTPTVPPSRKPTTRTTASIPVRINRRLRRCAAPVRSSDRRGHRARADCRCRRLRPPR